MFVHILFDYVVIRDNLFCGVVNLCVVFCVVVGFDSYFAICWADLLSSMATTCSHSVNAGKA